MKFRFRTKDVPKKKAIDKKVEVVEETNANLVMVIPDEKRTFNFNHKAQDSLPAEDMEAEDIKALGEETQHDVEVEEVGILAELLGDLDLTPEEYMEAHGLPELKNDDVEAAVLEAFSELVHESDCEELIELYNDEDLGLREKLEIAAKDYEEVEEEYDMEGELNDGEPKAEDSEPGIVKVTISPESEALYEKIEEAYMAFVSSLSYSGRRYLESEQGQTSGGETLEELARALQFTVYAGEFDYDTSDDYDWDQEEYEDDIYVPEESDINEEV